MTWTTYIIPILVILVVAYLFTKRSHEKPDTKLYMDRKDPRKLWAQAAMALYQGDKSDPGYWRSKEALDLMQNGWSTPDREALLRLIGKYIEGECNMAFDKLRIIWLARLGFGAGWLDEAASWNYVFNAVADLQNNYNSWDELRDASAVGRDQWYGNETPKSQIEWAKNNYIFASKKFLSQVPFR